MSGNWCDGLEMTPWRSTVVFTADKLGFIVITSIPQCLGVFSLSLYITERHLEKQFGEFVHYEILEHASEAKKVID